MRSIGAKNRNLVKRLTKEEIEKIECANWYLDTNYGLVEETVIEKLPIELWDTWEMADTEIRNIINDTIMEKVL